MGIWCSCVECIGWEAEQGIEKEPQVMDQSIKLAHDLDIIVTKADGTWSYRHDLEPGQLVEHPNDYEIVPHKSAEWQELHKSEADAVAFLTGGWEGETV